MAKQTNSIDEAVEELKQVLTNIKEKNLTELAEKSLERNQRERKSNPLFDKEKDK